MKYKAFKVDVANWPPRFCKLEMTFKRVKRTETETEPGQRTGRKRRGAETVCQAKDANAERNGSDDDDDDEKVVLAFTDPRRLGRVRLRDGNPLSSPPLSLLAPDPMEESGLGRTAEQAISILGATVAPIKSVLLDQSRLVCGVGNWVADDVLYEANIHPATKSRDLSNDQVLALLAAIKSICEQACAVGADASKFPPHWLFHYRWKMRPKTSQTVADGRYLACETMSGRTTVFVPKVQKKGNGGGGGRSSSSSSSKTAVVGAAAAKPKGNAKGKGKGGATPTAKGNAKAHARGKAKGGLPVEKKPNQEPSTSPPERKRKQQQQQPTKTVSLTAPTAAAGRRASQRRRF